MYLCVRRKEVFYLLPLCTSVYLCVLCVEVFYFKKIYKKAYIFFFRVRMPLRLGGIENEFESCVAYTAINITTNAERLMTGVIKSTWLFYFAKAPKGLNVKLRCRA